jgi:hypothetical protein
LTTDEESKLLRAGIAYSLAGDEGGLTRLHDHYQSFIAGASAPDALKVALSGMNGAQLTSTDFTRSSAENDSFVGWVQAMKERFRTHPAPVGNGLKALQPTSVATATPAPAKGQPAARPAAKG